MKRSKILKYITFLIIFTTIFSLNIDINVSQYGTSSSPNKHFLQLGIPKVEAAGDWVLKDTLTVTGDSGYEMKSNGVPETTSTLIYAEKVDNMLKIYKRQKYYDYDNGTTTLIKQYDMTNNSDFKIEVSSIKVSNFRVDYGTDYTDKLVINFQNFYVSVTDSISLSKTDINVTKTINEITYLYSDSSNKTNMCYSYGSRKGSWPDKSNCIATITINLKCYAMPNNQSPTIAITQPTPNSPLQALYNNAKEAV